MNVMFLLSAAAEGAGHEAEAHLLGLNAEEWVWTAVTIFFLIAIFVAKAHRQVLAILDAQIAETRKSLDEAKAIRGEAEALLAAAKKQEADSAREAAGIVAHAASEAEAIVAKAEADTTALIARREKMAEDKIGAAERTAVADLRLKAAEAASTAAAALIKAGHDAKADKKLVDEAIGAI